MTKTIIFLCPIWTQTLCSITLISCKPFIKLSYWSSNTGNFWVEIKNWDLRKHKYTISTNIQFPGFNIHFMPSKSANGGALLYIRDTINNKLRPDLNKAEKEKELESIFIEIL